MQDTGPVLQRLQMEAYRAVLRAMAVAPMQYVSHRNAGSTVVFTLTSCYAAQRMEQNADCL